MGRRLKSGRPPVRSRPWPPRRSHERSPVTAAKTARPRADEDKSNFRQRLLDALEASIAEDGYPRTTVADIVRRARTSRRTFYEHFESREACFVALLTDANAAQVRQIAGAVDPHAPWRNQVRQAVEAWVSFGEPG